MMSRCRAENPKIAGIARCKCQVAIHELRASRFESQEGSPRGILRFLAAPPQTIHAVATEASRPTHRRVAVVASRTSAELLGGLGGNQFRLADRGSRLVRGSAQPDDGSGR